MAALMSVLATACGNGSADSDGGVRAASLQPAPDAEPVDLAQGVLARVGGGVVTRGEFDRVFAVRVRGLGVRGGSRSVRRWRRAGLVRASMSQLILAEGIARRAEAAGVSVSAARVTGALDELREPFDSPAQWRQFLRRTHQTESEVRARLRLELLNRRVYAQHARTGSTKSAAKAARVSRERLRARTVCRSGYVVALCANSTSPTVAGR